MPRYLVLARSAPGPAPLSPEEIQHILERYRAWTQALRNAGGLLDSDKLRSREGRVVRRNGGELAVTDGPFAEAKEVIGGFWIIEAGSYDEVVQLLVDSPHLDFGSFEVRQIEELEPAS